MTTPTGGHQASGRSVRQDAGPRDRFGVVRLPLPVIAVRTVVLLAALAAIPLTFAWSGEPDLPHDVVDVQHRFRMQLAADGLDLPVSAALSPDGSLLFVAEKAGVVKVVDGIDGGEVREVIDLRDRVGSANDRGLVDLAVHPDFPATAVIYALYSSDAPPGEASPFWRDLCTGSDTGKPGCVVAGELVRIELGPSLEVVSTTVLLAGAWCQIGPSHGVSELLFGPDGKLYVAAGDGANFEYPDVGQHDADFPAGARRGCGDEPAGEGGSMRAQDAVTTDDPLSYNGAVIRFDPEAAVPQVELVAIGLRHPFGMTFRPELDELWLVDVGWKGFEEVNRIGGVQQRSSPVNFGWPCREGPFPLDEFGSIPLCRQLSGTGSLTAPYLASEVDETVDGCPKPTTAFTDVAFLDGDTWDGGPGSAMLVSDWGSGCITAYPLAAGMPDAGAAEGFVANAAIVDMDVLPDGRLLVVGLGIDRGQGHVAVLSPR